MSPRPPASSSGEGGGGTHSLLGLLFGVSLYQQAVLFRQLATMIDSGLTSSRALETLAQHTGGHFGAALADMVERLNEGAPLHKCLALYPEYFSELVVCLVQAGEVGGQLDVRLRELADMLEQSYDMRQQLLSQCAYPAFILHAGIFIPPLYTLITVGPSAYAVAVLGPLLTLWGALAALLLGNRLSTLVPPLRLAIDAIVLAMPLVGRVVRDGALLKSLRALADLLDASVPLGRAVQIASRTCGQAAVGNRLARVEDLVDEGQTLSGALARTGVLPPSAMQLVAVGEVSGSMVASLRKAADLLKIDYDNALRRMAAVTPALLLIVVAGMVGAQYVSFLREYVNLLNSVMP